MRLKSRGLGRKELVMDFREYTVTRDGDEVVVEGTIREPVHWDFSIRMCEDDLPGLARVALSPKTLGFLIRAAFRRKKNAHWSVDREEHLKDVQAAIEARAEAADSADAKKKASVSADAKKNDSGSVDAKKGPPVSSDGGETAVASPDDKKKTLSFARTNNKAPDTSAAKKDAPSADSETAVPFRAAERNAS